MAYRLKTFRVQFVAEPESFPADSPCRSSEDVHRLARAIYDTLDADKEHFVSHVCNIFALVQNPKRVGHSGCFEVSFQENHNRLLFVAEFVSDCHGETSGCQRLANRTTVRRKQAVKQ